MGVHLRIGARQQRFRRPVQVFRRIVIVGNRRNRRNQFARLAPQFADLVAQFADFLFRFAVDLPGFLDQFLRNLFLFFFVFLNMILLGYTRVF